MHRALALLVLALLPAPSRAQDPEPDTATVRSRVALEAAYLAQGLDDVMASPVRYAGVAPALGLGYAADAGDWHWSVRVVGTGPRLTSRLTATDGGYEKTAWVAGSAELLRQVWAAGAFRVWAGPGLEVTSGLRRHVYDAENWLNFGNTFVGLQAVARGGLAIGGGELSETLAASVLGVAVRKAYASVIDGEQRVRVGLPPGFLMLRHRLEYRVPGRGAVGARVFHEVLLVRDTRPLDLASAVQRVGLALEWRWGQP